MAWWVFFVWVEFFVGLGFFFWGGLVFWVIFVSGRFQKKIKHFNGSCKERLKICRCVCFHLWFNYLFILNTDVTICMIRSFLYTESKGRLWYIILYAVPGSTFILPLRFIFFLIYHITNETMARASDLLVGLHAAMVQKCSLCKKKHLLKLLFIVTLQGISNALNHRL